MSINRATVLGFVGNDPEIKTFDRGGKIASFSVATTEKWKDEQGDPKERTEWHKVSVQTDGLADIVDKYVRKGSKVYVEGKLETREWEDREGGFKRTATEIVLRPYGGKIELLDAPSKPEGKSTGRGRKNELNQ